MRWFVVAAALTLGACMRDPMGPSGLRLIVLDTQDSVWAARPGDDTLVRVRAFDPYGEPVAGARLTWEPNGTGSHVHHAAVVTDQRGFAIARWGIGTEAAEQQQLRLTARQASSVAAVVIQGRVVPEVVAALRVAVDTPLVFRLGDTLTVPVIALDPYSNTFPAPDLVLTSDDTVVVRSLGMTVTSAARRGTAMVTAASGGQTLRVPVRVVQVVAGIEPLVHTLRFSSLGAELPVQVVVRDDRGYVVPDTAVMIAVADTAVAQIVDGAVRSVGSGATTMRLSLGAVETAIEVAVRQRIASLRLVRDTMRLDALQDTTTVHLVARDSLGHIIHNPPVVYTVNDANVAKIGADLTLEALMPGTTVLTAVDTATGISVSADVVVAQRVATIEVAPLRFDAVGDSLPLVARARDRLGSIVDGAVLEFAVSDSAVAALASSGYVRSSGAGQALVSAREVESGTVGTAEVLVDPLAMTLTVAVDLEHAVVTLPAGASLPLVCEARDRNGFVVDRPAAFVSSARGTVSGPGCGSMQVQRSGYDTLRFALGQAHASVPVIIATRPDSVGIVAAATPLPTDERIRYVGEDLSHPSIVALRPMVAEILQAYGNPTSNLDRARALRDWVARTAIHPHPPLHPNGSTANLGVLPPGTTWADVNALPTSKFFDEDNWYWWAVGYDGYEMLNRLLGTLDPATGQRADDGMMERVDGVWYRIRDVQTYHYTLCSFQSIILSSLWASAGLHGTLISTLDHDPAAVFIPELNKWVYQDPTFNEEYLLDGAGDPLSPAELLEITSAGQGHRLHAVKMSGPSRDPQVYIPQLTYTTQHPEGMVIMGSQINGRIVGVGGWPARLVQIDVPALEQAAGFNNTAIYARVSATDAFPTLGVVVQEIRGEDSVYVAHLSATFPNHQRYEKRVAGGPWEVVGDVDVLPVGQCTVEYRSIDAAGVASASARLDLWIPRGTEFIQGGTGTRTSARPCS